MDPQTRPVRFHRGFFIKVSLLEALVLGCFQIDLGVGQMVVCIRPLSTILEQRQRLRSRCPLTYSLTSAKLKDTQKIPLNNVFVTFDQE